MLIPPSCAPLSQLSCSRSCCPPPPRPRRRRCPRETCSRPASSTGSTPCERATDSVRCTLAAPQPGGRTPHRLDGAGGLLQSLALHSPPHTRLDGLSALDSLVLPRDRLLVMDRRRESRLGRTLARSSTHRPQLAPEPRPPLESSRSALERFGRRRGARTSPRWDLRRLGRRHDRGDGIRPPRRLSS